MTDVENAPAENEDKIKIKVGGLELNFPIEVWGRPHNFEETEVECLWCLGDEHEGKRFEAYLFKKSSDGIRIPICTHHLTGHRIIMSLHKDGMDIEDIINMTPEERELWSHKIVLVPWEEI